MIEHETRRIPAKDGKPEAVFDNVKVYDLDSKETHQLGDFNKTVLHTLLDGKGYSLLVSVRAKGGNAYFDAVRVLKEIETSSMGAGVAAIAGAAKAKG